MLHKIPTMPDKNFGLGMTREQNSQIHILEFQNEEESLYGRTL